MRARILESEPSKNQYRHIGPKGKRPKTFCGALAGTKIKTHLGPFPN